MDSAEGRRRSLPPLHSPSLSDYSTASSCDNAAITLARSASTSSSSHGRREARPQQTYTSLPPPPQPLDYESPVPNRRPLPLPPIGPLRISPKRPPLPTIPPSDAGGKGKARLVVMDEEKQRYARALGLDTVGEESDGVTSPTSPPGYVQNREADGREGLSKGGRVQEETPVNDEKGRGELARVAEVQEREAEDELAQDSSEEKARLARAEEERSEEEHTRRQAVESAELAKEVSQMTLGDGRQTPPPPISPVSPSDLPTRGCYPLDSKELSTRRSPTNSLFDSATDDVPSYEAGHPAAPPTPPPPHNTSSFTTSHPRDYGQLPPPSTALQPPSALPLPPLHPRYATETPPPSFLPRSSAPPQPSSQYLMFNAPPAPPPTSYIADQPRLSPDSDERRPSLARHMSLQPSSGRPYLGGGGATSYASAAYAPPSGAERRAPVSRASIGPGGGGGFYSSGIGQSMHKDFAPVFESSTIGNAGSRRSPSPLRHPSANNFQESEGGSSSYSTHLPRSRAISQWGTTPLAPPSGFAEANPADYQQHFAQQSYQPPAPSTFAPSPQHQVPSPLQRLAQAPFAPPVVSSAGVQPAGYYTFSPGAAPIPFYNTSPVSPFPPTTTPGVYQQQPQASYFSAAPPHATQHVPSQLPPPPPPHVGYSTFNPTQTAQSQQHPHPAQGAPSLLSLDRPRRSRRRRARFGRLVEGA